MKQLIFLTALLFLTVTTFSQEKKEVKEEFIIPNNKNAINDLLEETKQKILDADKKVKAQQAYGQNLSAYKTKISAVDPTNVDLIYSSISNNIASNDNDAIYLQEEALINFIQSLSFYYRTFGTSTDYIFDNSLYSEFSTKASDALKPLQSSDLLRLMANNHDNDNNKPIIIDINKLQSLKQVISSSTISEIKTKLTLLIDAEIVKSKKDIEDAQSELQTLKSNRSKILEKLNEEETQINDLAIKLGLPLFCVTILLLFLGPTFINRSNQQQKNETSSQNVLLEISTVLLLTMSILILGLSGKIQSDVLGTLIGGISGYVLNRIRTRNDVPAESK